MSSKPPRTPGAPVPPQDDAEERLVTSEDLFGDMVDAPLDEPRKRVRDGQGPIKVQVPEPGKERLDRREQALPDEMSALLNAFGAESSRARAEPQLPAAPGADPALLDDIVGESGPGPGSDFSDGARSTAQADTDALLGAVGEAVARGVQDVPSSPASQAPSAPEADLSEATPLPEVAAPSEPEPVRRVPPAPKPEPAAQPPAAAADDDGEMVVDLAELAAEAMESTPAASSGARAEAPPPAPGALSTAGTSYGPYELLELVARGGMAEVFKAKRSGVEGFEKIVAVKRILPLLSGNREFVEMFVDEAKLVAGLTHPNIVQIFDLGAIEKSYYIAMEFVQGRDLRSIQKRAAERDLRIPMDLSGLIISRVCLALEFAHRKKDDGGRLLRLVHRDISPQNILISFEGDVKLTDFGIAKAATKASTTDAGALRGKLLYMSPEQAWGQAVDRRSDIFSLGIVFYELLAGQRPFKPAKSKSVLETVRQCQLVPLATANPRVPEAVQKIVDRALEKDPEDRYQNASEMHRDLERVLHERQAPTSAELSRFLELIFDQEERGEPIPSEDSGESWPEARLEIDFDTNPADSTDPADALEPINDPEDAEKTAPGVPRERSEIQKILERFRWK